MDRHEIRAHGSLERGGTRSCCHPRQLLRATACRYKWKIAAFKNTLSKLSIAGRKFTTPNSGPRPDSTLCQPITRRLGYIRRLTREDIMQRAIICVGDRTSHGGVVVTGDQTVNVYGRVAARKGDLTACPKCSGTHPIIDGATALGTDRPLALEGMRTTCGATLIASQHFWTQEYGGGAPSAASSVSSSPSSNCRHPDDAVAVAQWLVVRMNANPFTPEGRQILADNSYDAQEEAIRWNALPWYRQLIEPSNFTTIAEARKAAAYSLWTKMVATRHPWDFKRDIAREFPTPAGKTSAGWYKYKNYDYFTDIWANIHYGYVGIAIGFSADELLNGAGLAQIWSDRPKMQNHPANGPWPKSADDAQDNISIRLGVDLVPIAPPGSLTTDILLQRLEDEPLPWGESPKGAKRLHVCEPT